MIPKISLKDLPKYLDKGAVLVDVREKEEYQKKHLEHAINIPEKEIFNQIKNYSSDTIFILYCSSGMRSKLAASKLISIGYKEVYDLGRVTF